MYIQDKLISNSSPTYFIADIGANHDGDLERAKDLIYLAAESGADAVKFQHFAAETIVSDHGFKSLGTQLSHQSSWKDSVFNVYKKASLNLEWTPLLKETCDKANICFFTSPYSFDLVDHVNEYIPAFKIGSGDITWIEIIKYIASKNKPYILATGASSLQDVDRAVQSAISINKDFCLMQCNTNYTGSEDNYRYINLNVLLTYRDLYPDIILGLSDHTPGHSSVLGAISLGARMIEKHFTDDINRNGPDHAFAMDPYTWSEMIMRSRELESSLGSCEKKVEENENHTVILQRRSIRLKTNLVNSHVITKEDLICLRPCPNDSIMPYDIDKVIGKKLNKSKAQGEYLKWEDIN